MNLPMTIFVNSKYYSSVEEKVLPVYETMFNKTNSALQRIGLQFTVNTPKPVITSVQEVDGGWNVDMTFSFAEELTEDERAAFNDLVNAVYKRLLK